MGSRYNISDFDIQALIDNELTWEREKEVLSYLEHDPQAKRRYNELSRQKTLLQKWALFKKIQ